MRPTRRPSFAAVAALAPAALVSIALAPAAAGAAPAVAGEFALTETPHQLTQGPDGNVWVTLDGVVNDLARIAPDGTVTEFANTALRAPVGIAAGSDGNLWITQANEVVRVPPAAPTTGTAFPAPAIGTAQEIVAGPDGNLWTASLDNALRITPAGTVRQFLVSGMQARGIANAGDGTLAIADFGGQRIVRLTTEGAPTFVPTGGNPMDVAAGAGGNLAFTNPLANPQQLGRLAPGGAPVTTDVPGTDPFGIAFGADGAYWVANFARDDLSRLAADGTVTPLAGLSAGSGPRWIAAGPGNTLWVSLERSRRVARITGVDPAPTGRGDNGRGGGDRGGGDRGGGGTNDTTAPVVSSLSVTLRRTRTGGRGHATFTLSERATATVRLERRLSGRRAGGRCVAPARARRGAKRCIRWVAATAPVRRTLPGGRRVVALAGGRVLAPGRYRVSVSARDAAGNATRTPRIVRFTVRAR
jgi:streptogramin lyase